MNRLLHHAAFATGLIAVGWVGAGYLPGNPTALALVGLIGAFFALGAFELHRFHRATRGLAEAVDAAATPTASLGDWLARVPANLQPAVRLRVESERAALPGPALAPYLAGLLVLLGMLGTFLGMVATLKGTGLALDHATDVDAIRASLAAPVRGLGLAFGTSVAGVAASAMLGLMSALARRDRQRVVQALDTRIAGALRPFSAAHQREASLRLLQAQADALPALVTQVAALVAQMERQGTALQDRLVDGQSRFHDDARDRYTALAASVDRSLKDSLAESARLAGAALQPAVAATMAGLAEEAATLRGALHEAARQQLDGTAERLDATAAALTHRWQDALAGQQRQAEAVTQQLAATLDRFAGAFEARAVALVDGVAAQLDRSTGAVAATWEQALERQRQGHDTLVAAHRDAWADLAAGFRTHADHLLRSVADAHARWDTELAAREQERSAGFHAALATASDTLRRHAEDDGAALAERQQRICTTLERTAQAITAQAEAQARATIDEIARLVQTAAEAPRAAAAMVGELRTALSDSLVRDNAALDERNRLLGTLSGLLDAVNHASTEQRAAIDALVQTSTDVLERVGGRFAETVDHQARGLQAVADQVSASAAEVASLGDGFGVAVTAFGRASETLTDQLHRVEQALGQSLARSDEQLAYYVAQAREIVDLTLGSQKQILEDLQQLAAPRAPTTANAEAA